MRIEELMQRPAETLPPTASCSDAAAMMRDQRVGSVVVIEHERPIGIVTDRDLVLRVMAEQRDPNHISVRAVMSGYPVLCAKVSSLADALRTMRGAGVRRIPVVDADGCIAGMLSLDDVLIKLGREIGRLSEVVEAELSKHG